MRCTLLVGTPCFLVSKQNQGMRPFLPFVQPEKFEKLSREQKAESRERASAWVAPQSSVHIHRMEEEDQQENIIMIRGFPVSFPKVK